MVRASIDEFKRKAILIHSDRYDYSLVDYKRSDQKVAIVCKEHGAFFQTPHAHIIKKQGCRKCNRKGLFTPYGYQDFIAKAKEKHGDIYVYEEYTNYKTPINIQCKEHGVFSQRPKNHLGGAGCPKCAVILTRDKNVQAVARLSLLEFINKATAIHKGYYDYGCTIFAEYSNNRDKVRIKCPKHGVFKQIIHAHLSGSGCPKCSVRISKPQEAWLDSLGVHLNNREVRIPVGNRGYIVDGLCNNIVYEFLGDYWHGNPDKFNYNDIHPLIDISFGELYNRTITRLDEIRNAGYTVVHIWESEWNEHCKSQK